MPQMIQIDDSARRTINPAVGNAPTMQADANAFGGQIGRALQGAGQELQQFANFYAQEQQQREKFKTTTSFIEKQSELEAGLDQAARDADGTDANGFTKSTMAGVRAQWDEWIKKQNFTPEQKAEWESKVAASNASFSKAALGTEFSTYDNFQIKKLGEGKDLAAKRIASLPVDATPAQFETELGKVSEQIDATNYSDEKKQQLKDEWKQQAAAVRIKAIADADPKKASEMLGMPKDTVDIVVDKITGHESGGDPNAQNDRSSAGGLGQFIDSTWVATIRKHRPDLAGYSKEEILAMKTDAGLNREMTKALTQDNAKILQAKGLPVTEANLYLMHFAGEAGGPKILQASDNALISDVMGPGEIKANPFLEGKTVGWVKDWAGRVMKAQKATPGTIDPTVSSLTYKSQQDLMDYTSQQIKLQQQAAAADQQKAYNDWFNGFQSDLIQGTKGRQAVDNAIREGQLTNADDMLKAYSIADQTTKRGVDLDRFNAKNNDPGATWDGANNDDRDAVKAAVTNLGGTAEAAFQVQQRTGILDERGATKIRAGLNSTDPEQIKAVGQISMNMLTKNNNPFAGVEGGADLLKKAATFWTMVNTKGMTADAAAARLAQLNDPTRQEKVLPEQVSSFRSDLVKNMTPDKIAGMFNPEGWEGAPSVPMGYGQSTQLQSEFIVAAEEAFKETGDPDVAQEMAKRTIAQTWGTFNGALMKYPPSKAYPAVNRGDGGDPHAYITEQATEDAKRDLMARSDFTMGETVTGVYLKPIEGTGQGKGITEEAWRRGGLVLDNSNRDKQGKSDLKVVPYELWYFRKMGDGQLIAEKAPLPFVADPREPAQQAEDIRRAGAQQLREQQLKIQQDREAGKAEYLPQMRENLNGPGNLFFKQTQDPENRQPGFKPFGQDPLTPASPPSMTDELPVDPMQMNPGDF